MRVRNVGPCPAPILIVGEAPGAEEERQGEPFVGASGQELTRMLNDAGILRTECRITNVVQKRPPRNDISAFFLKRTSAQWIPGPEINEGLADLAKEIAACKPRVIIALGDTALWALTGERGITKWRGSYLDLRPEMGGPGPIVIPTYHPAAILRQWAWRATAVQDLRRARAALDEPPEPPATSFLLRPSLDRALEVLAGLMPQGEPRPLAVDIETRAGQIACLGIAWSPRDAICIPFLDVKRPDGSYWPTADEELAVVKALRGLLTHPLVEIIGQNFLYDAQYIARHWGFLPVASFDTMCAHAVAFPGTPKSLDYLSSLYCRWHRYWKDDGKEWSSKLDEELLWAYNARDCVVTFEVAGELRRVLRQLNLEPQFAFIMSLHRPLLAMMLRGVRSDTKLRGELMWELQEAMAEREAFFERVVGRRSFAKSKNASPWWSSPKQLQTLFYEHLGLPPIRHRKTGRPTVDDDALQRLAKREPLVLPICRTLQEYRSTGVFLRNFIQAPLDHDGRIRCSYNPVGTETFRFSSSADVFGFNSNLQNVPKGGRVGRFSLPNVRRLFVPDPGYIIADCDLDRADLQIVVWESGDEELKQMLREGVDVHSENARVLGVPRDFAKRFCHAANYGVGARTLASGLGITVHQAELFLKRWFQAHPRIREWHRRVERSLAETRSVRNPFGFRRYYFDRIEGLLPEALAWVPQSSVAIITNMGLRNLYENVPEVQLLLQVHDSIVFQYPAHLDPQIRPRIREQLLIRVPYDDPLIIPVGLKISRSSWGEVEEAPWEA